LDRPQLDLEIRLTREVAMDPSAGFVHEEIGRAMAAAHSLVQPLRARGIGQIGHDHRHLARAVGLKLARRLLQLGPVIGGDDSARAVLCKASGEREPDAARCARDERDTLRTNHDTSVAMQ
jgi:predicted urease superfamily metal-dependent hydrolase